MEVFLATTEVEAEELAAAASVATCRRSVDIERRLWSWWYSRASCLLAATEADVEAAVTEDEDRATLVEVEEANTPYSNRHAH